MNNFVLCVSAFFQLDLIGTIWERLNYLIAILFEPSSVRYLKPKALRFCLSLRFASWTSMCSAFWFVRLLGSFASQSLSTVQRSSLSRAFSKNKCSIQTFPSKCHSRMHSSTHTHTRARAHAHSHSHTHPPSPAQTLAHLFSSFAHSISGHLCRTQPSLSGERAFVHFARRASTFLRIRLFAALLPLARNALNMLKPCT